MAYVPMCGIIASIYVMNAAARRRQEEEERQEKDKEKEVENKE